MVFGCFDTMIVLFEGIVRRARGSSIYMKAPVRGDGISILIGLLLEKSRLSRKLFLSGAQFSVVVFLPPAGVATGLRVARYSELGVGIAATPVTHGRHRAFQTSGLDSGLKVPFR